MERNYDDFVGAIGKRLNKRDMEKYLKIPEKKLWKWFCTGMTQKEVIEKIRK